MEGPATYLSDYFHWFVDRDGRHWKLGPWCCTTKGVRFRDAVLVKRYPFFVGALGSLRALQLQQFLDESKPIWVKPGFRYDEETGMTNRTDLSILFRALGFAADHHRDDRRKGVGASPYINHPIAVASELVGAGVEDVEVIAAALLHDTVEDTWATPEDIGAQFGPRVQELVEAVTDDKSLKSRERRRLQVVHAPDLDPGAKLIKIADKTANVHDVGHDPPASWPLQRRRDYLEWTERVVEGCRGVNDTLERRYDDELSSARYRVKQALEAEGSE